MTEKELLRNLPKIDEILNKKEICSLLGKNLRPVIVEAIRESVDYYRKKIISHELSEINMENIVQRVLNIVESEKQGNLKTVINATGVIIHTNLGRSKLSVRAMNNVINISQNYSNLEYDIHQGKRGSRYSHVEELIKKVTGAEAALVVNNNAAAVMLALNTLCDNKEAIVSRGQLVEIGGSFRVPDVMAFSGAKLIEVGTTNRTHIYDYENNINENTGVILKVHTSNFKITGFTEEVSIEDMVKLGKKYNVPVIEDIGSGTLVDFSKYGFSHEPTVQESINNGIDVVTFSGDKMLGGPQAGIIIGKKIYIDAMKKNQLTRALRIDKMTLAALEGTLYYYLDESEAVKNIPTLNMILSSKEVIKKKAQGLKRKLQIKSNNFSFKIEPDLSMVGGGSMPSERIDTYTLKVKHKTIPAQQLEEKLRMNKIPIIVRVSNDEVIFDLRTIEDKDFQVIAEAIINLD
jgi:L-seryl-tRNA(Ser) seleniumtransferase